MSEMYADEKKIFAYTENFKEKLITNLNTQKPVTLPTF